MKVLTFDRQNNSAKGDRSYMLLCAISDFYSANKDNADEHGIKVSLNSQENYLIECRTVSSTWHGMQYLAFPLFQIGFTGLLLPVRNVDAFIDALS